MPPKRKYNRRGPKCPVCGARMYLDDKGTAKCSFESSHANIIKMRIASSEQAAQKNRKKKK